MAYTVQIGGRQFHVARGNLHLHTIDSDGTKSHEELAQIADEAGLDFIVVTDHNVFRPGQDRFVGNTLLLVGEEIHDVNRQPQSSHSLCFNIREDLVSLGADPQLLIDAVATQEGFVFLAHPFERKAADFLPEPNISWRDWQVEAYAGLELWNCMSEFKAVLRNQPEAVLFAYLPAFAISGPYPETLRKWDELLRTRPVSAFGGSDAHGTVYHLGPLSRAVLPYDYLFRCINTHLLLEEPLARDVEHDKVLIYKALRAGNGFIAYERPADCSGFTFWARSRDAEATMGETLTMRNAVELRVDAPLSAELRLVRDGQVIAKTHGRQLALMTLQPGAYRAEAYRRYAARRRGWIFSNPIYVH